MKKFDSETRKRIFDAVKQGATDHVAAGYADITYQRLRSWLRRGEIEVKRIEDSDVALPIVSEQEYAQFYIDYKKYESELAVKLIGSVAASRAWRAKAWTLERRYPNEYGRDSVAPNESEDAADWWKAAESLFDALEVATE